MHSTVLLIAVSLSIIVISEGCPAKWKGPDDTDIAEPSERPIKSVKLTKDKIYNFEASNVGLFLILGGSSGQWYIDGAKVTIRDMTYGNEIFSAGGQNDRVSIQDNLENGTTTVTLLPGQGSPDPEEEYTDREVSTDSSSWKMKGGCDLMQQKDRKVNPSAESWKSIPIQAFPNQAIVLRGSRNFVVTGNGSSLTAVGTGDVTFHGDLRSLVKIGSGDLIVNGKVAGNVHQFGPGSIQINGPVQGLVTQLETGNLIVYGDVVEGISQTGVGNIDVYGTNLGYVIKVGLGKVNFHRGIVARVRNLLGWST